MYCYASAHLAQAYGKEKRRGYFPLVVTYCDPICNTEICAAVRCLKMRDFDHRRLEVNTGSSCYTKVVEFKIKQNKTQFC